MTRIKRSRGESRITGRDIDAGSVQAGCTFRMNHLTSAATNCPVRQPAGTLVS